MDAFVLSSRQFLSSKVKAGKKKKNPSLKVKNNIQES